jgi:hypothetical protein
LTRLLNDIQDTYILTTTTRNYTLTMAKTRLSLSICVETRPRALRRRKYSPPLWKKSSKEENVVLKSRSPPPVGPSCLCFPSTHRPERWTYGRPLSAATCFHVLPPSVGAGKGENKEGGRRHVAGGTTPARTRAAPSSTPPLPPIDTSSSSASLAAPPSASAHPSAPRVATCPRRSRCLLRPCPCHNEPHRREYRPQ